MESFDAHPLKYYYLHSRWFLSSITHCALYYNHWLIPLGIHSNAIISHRPISLHGKSDLTNRFIDFLSRSNLDFFVGVLTAVKVSLAPTPLLMCHIFWSATVIFVSTRQQKEGGKKTGKRKPHVSLYKYKRVMLGLKMTGQGRMSCRYLIRMDTTRKRLSSFLLLSFVCVCAVSPIRFPLLPLAAQAVWQTVKE